ncbi:MAG TPA: cysteine desulfurase family protein, partial [Micavibrio sp.]|nr:cysteine desulfurase family protein [Micavibrio sp.]
MRRIYLDYNATCPIFPEAIDAAAAAMAHTGNASSIHADGRAARKIVEDSRGDVAKLANVRAAQVIFNSGATEGNNTILSGYQDKTVLVSPMEHPSILEAAPKADYLPVTKDGLVDLEKFEALMQVSAPALVCVQLVNSETGVIQPVADIARLAKAKGAMVHCDAVQAAGRIAIDFPSLGVDYLTLSAHKFGGPQGIGALIFREGLQMPKFMRGGGQEKRQRAGTENVAAIAGFAAAATRALENIDTYQSRCKAFQAKLESALRSCANDIIIAGENAPRVSNTTNVILPGASAETQLMAMDLEGIAVSSGSACSSGTFKPSHVLAAMGHGADEARSALRFSTGWATTDADIDEATAAYAR